MILSSTGFWQSITKLSAFFFPFTGAAAGFFPTAMVTCTHRPVRRDSVQDPLASRLQNGFATRYSSIKQYHQGSNISKEIYIQECCWAALNEAHGCTTATAQPPTSGHTIAQHFAKQHRQIYKVSELIADNRHGQLTHHKQ